MSPSVVVFKGRRWRMIPVVTVVAITLIGIEGIADELEMPFGKSSYHLTLTNITKPRLGTDTCDLPLGILFYSS
jgi:predicted membrane chloride channel (bestrophin family)